MSYLCTSYSNKFALVKERLSFDLEVNIYLFVLENSLPFDWTVKLVT